MARLKAVAGNGSDWQAKTADPLLVVALASGATVKDAAERAGVSERTAWRRLADPAFLRCVAEAKADLVTRAVALLADGATKAAETLVAVMDCEEPRARIAAAKAVLELALPYRVVLLDEAAALRPWHREPTDMAEVFDTLQTTAVPDGPERALPALFDTAATDAASLPQAGANRVRTGGSLTR